MSNRDDRTDEDDRRPTGHESESHDRRDETRSNEDVSRRTEETVEEREYVAESDERVSAGGDGEGDRSQQRDDDGGGLSGGLAVLISALVALVVTALAYWWVGGWAGSGVFFEELYRVAPTVSGGGVGADWVAGNTVPWLDALIAIVHAADVLMGVMILAMVFLHWAIFRRLGDRMQAPVDRRTGDAVATDGGASREDPEGADGDHGRADGTDDARGGDHS